MLTTTILARTLSFALLLATEPAVLTPQGVELETQKRIETDVRGYLSTLCPAQCELGEVKVKMAPRKPPPGTTPGFEELSADVKDSVVQSVEIGVLVDKRLPAAFRSGVKTVLERRLAGAGYKATVHESVLQMPLPQELPEAQKTPPPQPAMQAALPDKALPQTSAETVARNGLGRWLDALPLLAGLFLCGAIVFYTLRQYSRLLESKLGRGEADAAETDANAQSRALVKSDGAQQAARELAQLGERLMASPGLRREVLRTWLREGPMEEVAIAVLVLGAEMLAEVRADPDCQEALDALDAELAQTNPEVSAAARVKLAAKVRLRVRRAEVRRGTDAVGDAMAELASADEELFVRALAQQEEEVQSALLRYAPERLQRAAFAALPPPEQARMMRALLIPETCSRDRVLDGAEAIRAQLAGQSAGLLAKQARVAAQLLEMADAIERRRILQSLRQSDEQAYRKVLAELVTEETLAALPAEVLGAALLRLDIGQAALALSDLDRAVRARVLANLPPQQAQAIEDEEEALATTGGRREAARRTALAEVRRVAIERRVDLYEINRRALREPRLEEEALA